MAFILFSVSIIAWSASVVSALRAFRAPRPSYADWNAAVHELYEELGPPTARSYRDPRKAWRRGESAVGFAMAVTR